jgi:hypothetical protein
MPQSEGGISVAEAAQALDAARDEHADAEAALRAARATFGADAVATSQERERLTRAVEVAVAAVGEEPEGTLEAAREELAALRREVEADDYPATRERRDAALSELEALATELAEAKARRDEAQGRVSTLQELAGKDDACTHCGASDPLGIGAALTEAVEHLEAAEAAVSDIAFDRNQANAKRNALVGQARAAARAIQGATAAVERHKSYEAAARTHAGAQAALDAFLGEHGEVAEVDTSRAEQRATAAKHALLRAQDEHRAAARREDRDRSYMAAIEAREVAKVAWDDAKALVAGVRSAQEALSMLALADLQREATDLLGALGFDWVVSIKGPSNFSVEKGGATVSYWGLSRSERAIVGAAMAYAVAVVTDSPARLIVLDDLECIDPDRLERLLSFMVEAVCEDRIHGFLGALRGEVSKVAAQLTETGASFHGAQALALAQPEAEAA